jgi:exoribonuclease R
MQSKQLVEEFMLLANVLIAEHLYKTCKDKTILRAHDAIKENRRENMVNYFDKIGLKINM